MTTETKLEEMQKAVFTGTHCIFGSEVTEHCTVRLAFQRQKGQECGSCGLSFLYSYCDMCPKIILHNANLINGLIPKKQKHKKR